MAAARQHRPDEQWYINDHCFFLDEQHTLHWFGITNPYPDDGNLYGPGTHRHIGHATATHPFGPWEEHPHAMALPLGSSGNIGACFVIRSGGGYLMIYGYNTGFYCAGSRNLVEWTPLDDMAVLDLGPGTRDPCVLTLDDGTYLLYGAAGHQGASAVVLAQSDDLRHWTPCEPALMSDIHAAWGALESPFVHRRADDYYLFVNHSHRQYEETLVFHSRDPRHFDWQAPICTLFAHAAEIVEWQGQTYISHCGIEDRHWSDTGAPYGLWLAQLDWLSQPA
jgi:hypothetical protein